MLGALVWIEHSISVIDIFDWCFEIIQLAYTILQKILNLRAFSLCFHGQKPYYLINGLTSLNTHERAHCFYVFYGIYSFFTDFGCQ